MMVVAPIDLIQLTNDPHCSLPMLVDMLSDRFRNSNWVVVFKALIVTHNLMTLGNEVPRWLLPLLMHTTIYTLYCNYIVTGIMYDISWK